MTIKKRLTISNVLMIVIPLATTAIVGGLCVLFATLLFSAGTGLVQEDENFYEHKDVLVARINDSLDATGTDALDGAFSAIEGLDVRLRVMVDDALGYDKGVTNALDDDLAQHASAGELCVIKNDRQAYLYDHAANGVTYHVQVFCTLNNEALPSYEAVVFVTIFIMVVVILLSVLLTSKFLSRFAFKKIQEPLDLLRAAAKRVTDGDLDTTIDYEDETEFKPIIDEFNHMCRELKESMNRMKENDENRQLLIAGITHDLKSPLTSIRGYVEGLIDGVADTELKKSRYLSVIKEKCLEIDELLHQMILLTRPDKPVVEESSITSLIASYLAINATEYAKKDLTIIAELHDDFPVHLNKESMDRVLNNIFDNSVKYKTKPVGTIRVETVTQDGEDRLVLSDDGPGLPTEDVAHVFDAFYRGDEARTHPENGSGLGLSIVKKIIEGAGGMIRAESHDGFTIIITFKGGCHEQNTDH